MIFYFYYNGLKFAAKESKFLDPIYYPNPTQYDIDNNFQPIVMLFWYNKNGDKVIGGMPCFNSYDYDERIKVYSEYIKTTDKYLLT